MTLLDYWPTDEAIYSCIPSEAESLSDEVFLAVHQPIRLHRRRIRSTDGDASEQGKNERDLLEALLGKLPPEGYNIVPIVGPSGVGKSHLIRWLDLHISRKNRHVIRIAKSTSLRGILQEILKDLQGPTYDRIREQLETARDKLDKITAEEELLAQFRAMLRQRKASAKAECDAALERGEEPSREQREILQTHAEGLYQILEGGTKDALLADSEEHPSVFQSLIERITEGLIDAKNGEFLPDHFAFPNVKTDDVDSNATKYLGKLKLRAKTRESAARLMNDIRDDAVAQLLGLGENQLADLFRAVREELLRENYELILLIEDFTTLSGLQGGLLDVIKLDVERSGKKVLCPMRTAMAVTEGFLSKYDTIRTRAGTEWVLGEVPIDDPNEILATLTDMVGAYLNAARLGREKLAPLLADRKMEVPRFEDHADPLSETDQTALEAFEVSRNDHSLFPFNKQAVARLARQYLTRQGRVILNPRELIKDILQGTLREYRHTFEAEKFPPAKFHNFDPNPLGGEMNAWLSRQQPAEYTRYAVLVGYWGGHIKDPDALRLAAPIYEAFGLPPLGDATQQQPPKLEPPKPERTEPVSPEPTAAEPEPEIDPKLARELQIIATWAERRDMLPQEARGLRRHLIEAIESGVDWGALLLEEPSLEAAQWGKWIYLPYAQGGEPTCSADNALFTLCRDEVFDDPARFAEIQLQLEAMIRFHHHKSFDYERGEEDRARYAALVRRAVKQAVPFLEARYEGLPPGDPVPAVAQSLLLSARILNANNPHKDEDATFLRVLFEGAPHKLPQGMDLWSSLCRSVAAERPRAQQFLLRRVGARQGKGEAMYALDAARLLEALAPLRSSWRVEAEFPGGGKPLDNEGPYLQAFVKSTNTKAVERALAERSKRLLNWANTTRTWLGTPFDKTALVDAMKETLTRAKRLGVFVQHDVSYEKLREMINTFRDSAIADNLKEAERLADSLSASAMLTVLSKVDDDILVEVDRLREEMDAVLKETASHAESKLRGLLTRMGVESVDVESAIDPKDIVGRRAKEIDDALKEIADAVSATSDNPQLAREGAS